ncbi:response regulator transcription factor [Streptomyces sp. NPDC051773]|uniref:helix-turn-helix transcriptional regulator n=1 Tax=Streptomyces sp. NPDC051773 TaxID=3156682 RepID=UPI00342A188D
MSQAMAGSGWDVSAWSETPSAGGTVADVVVTESGVLSTAGTSFAATRAPVIVLVSGSDDPFWDSRQQFRVAGIVDRDDPDHEFVTAVRQVLGGRGWLSPELVHHVLEDVRRVPRQFTKGTRGLGELTGREWDVARLVAKGLSNTEIAGELIVELSTVKFHVSNVLRKLECRDRSQLVAVMHAGRYLAGSL